MKYLIGLFLALSTASIAWAGSWKYHDDRDEMRGTTTHFAVQQSLNKVNFAFPYNGGSHLNLYLGKTPAVDGHSLCGREQCSGVMLVISKGQIVCAPMHEYDSDQDSCFISVKFDDAKVERLVVKTISQDSVAFRHDANIRFFEAVKTAKKLTIEVAFYNEGPRQFQFDLAGLKWEDDSSSPKLPGY